MPAFSQKQITAITKSKSRINILEGSVRSGKSFASYFLLMDFALKGITGAPMVIIGRTERTIKRNIIDPLYELVGNDMTYHVSKAEITLWGRTIHVISANDDRAEGKIRGSEFVFCLIDELTLIPENFVKMLFSRINRDGAMIVATTNPDSPFNWVKKDLIDCKDDLDMTVHKFILDDNPILTDKFKENIKKEYKGLWYRRFILGEWVQAEGAIFDFFDTDIHVIDSKPGLANYYIVGIDYGTTNPCAFLMVGYNNSLYPNAWVEKEYYYDHKLYNRQKTDSEYAKDLVNFIDGYHVKSIYIDPSAASFKQELFRSRIGNLLDADNSVLDGIRFVSTMITNGTVKICSCCKNLISEMSTYVWDEKLAMKGIEKPVKQSDHLIDSLRYTLFSHFTAYTGSTMTEKDAKTLENKYYLGI